MMPFHAMRMRSNGDPYFSAVSLLLHGDGSSGSTTITDSSNSHKAATRFGNVQVSTAQAKFEQSLVFDGSGDSVLYPHTSDLHLTGDFTIELWVYVAAGSSGVLLCKGGGLNIAWPSYFLLFDGTNINFAASSTNAGLEVGSETGATGRLGAVTLNAWNHVAVTRQGNVWRGFVNGVQGYTQTLSNVPYDSSPRGLAVGSNFANTWGSGTPTASLNGYIDDLRITKGVARYTANFTPPAAVFPNS